MVTRQELRAGVRQRLGDAGAVPLWDDSALDRALGDALSWYGTRRPLAVTVAVPVASGDDTIDLAVAAPAVNRARPLRLRDAQGVVVPELDPRAGWSAGQGWWRWGPTVYLRRPVLAVEAGAWRLHGFAARELIADDVTAQPIEPGEDAAVVAAAAAVLIERQLVEDGKRGRGGAWGELAPQLWREAAGWLARRDVVASYVVIA